MLVTLGAAGVANDQFSVFGNVFTSSDRAEFTRSSDGLCNARYIARVSNNRYRAFIIDRREFFNDTLYRPTRRCLFHRSIAIMADRRRLSIERETRAGRKQRTCRKQSCGLAGGFRKFLLVQLGVIRSADLSTAIDDEICRRRWNSNPRL